jgi:outer membrane cobalamin receptor
MRPEPPCPALRPWTALLAAALLACPAAGADDPVSDEEEAGDQDEEVMKTVVTATRFDTEKGNVPASVTVLGADEISRRPFLTVDGLLTTEASFSEQRYQSFGNAYPHTLTLRGISGIDRVLVLLDGLPLHDAMTGGVNLNLLPSEDILRVELVRGPFSALYGSHAMAGVLHVVTMPGGYEPGVKLKAGIGMVNALQASMRGAFKAGPFEAALRYGLSSSDNYMGQLSEKNLDYLHHNLNARIDILRGKSVSLKLIGGYFDSNMGFNQYVDLREYGMDLHLRNEGRNDKDNGYGRLALRWKPLAVLEISAASGFMFQQQSFHAVPAYDAWRVHADLLARWSAARWMDVTAGFDQSWDMGDWNVVHFDDGSLVTGMDARTSVSAGYLQIEWRTLQERLRAIAGARLDRHSSFGLAFSPKVGASLQAWKGGTIHWSYGRAFRAPSLTELYSPPWKRIPPYLTVGSEDLLPETLDAVDAGVSQTIAFAELKATAFHNLGRNFIELRLMPDGLEHTINLKRVRTAGAELEIEMSWTRHLHVRASYTYTWSEDMATGEPLDYVPAHMAGLGIQATWSVGEAHLMLAADVTCMAERTYSEVRAPDRRGTLAPYGLGNAQAAVTWQGFTFFLQAFNLWNMRYEVNEGMEAARFLLFGGLRLDLTFAN